MGSLSGDDFKSYFERPPRSKFRTGFRALDWATGGGLRVGDVSIIGAQTGVGKTAFAEQLALNMSRDVDVMFLPLEAGYEDTILRIGAKLDRRARVTKLYDVPITRQASPGTITELNNRGLYIFEPASSHFTVNDLMLKMSQMYCPVVIVDHVRHITGWLNEGAKSTFVGPSLILQHLQHAARELQIHLVLCAQLNRAAFGHRPTIANLQDTSSLEQLASQVLLLHRPFRGDGIDKDVVMELTIAKNRTGPQCMVHYHWDGENMMLMPMTDEEQAAVTCCDGSAK